MRQSIRLTLLAHVGCFFVLSSVAEGFHIGVGYSSLTSGRTVPALNFGTPIWDDYTVSGFAAGVATKSYYSSSYGVNFLKYGKWSNSFVGTIKMGFGLGAHYNKKGIITQFEDDGTEKEIDTDEDLIGGPAFRVSIVPGYAVMICFEYMFGVGTGLFLNGWGDEGIFAIGMEL